MASGSFWSAAAAKFTGDTYFYGADGGASIDLGSTRVLWTFGDSLIRTTPGQARSATTLIRNCVALQTVSYDLSAATMTFYCGGGGLGSSTPDSFFPQQSVDGSPSWFWPFGGIVIDGLLFVFCLREEPFPAGPPGFQFQTSGWSVVMVENPTAAPSSWQIRHLPTPSELSFPFGTSFQDVGDGFVYAETYGVLDGKLYAVRFDRAKLKLGDVMTPQYWCGPTFGWQARSPQVVSRLKALSPSSSVDGTVAKRASDWIHVQSTGFVGTSPMAYAKTTSLTNGFGALTSFYTPYGDDPFMNKASSQYIVYQGKAHPEQTWAGKGANDVLLTYAIGADGGNNIFTDTNTYWIRPAKGTGLT